MGKEKTDEVDHHIIPTAQGGPDDFWNRFSWERELEEHWHKLFGTLLPSDCITLIRKWRKDDGFLDERQMTPRDIESFEKVFGSRDATSAINFIEKNFLPAEHRFFQEKRRQ